MLQYCQMAIDLTTSVTYPTLVNKSDYLTGNNDTGALESLLSNYFKLNGICDEQQTRVF